MPRLLLTFDPLPDPGYSRRLESEEVGDATTRITRFESIKDDTAIVTVPDARGVKFFVFLLDEKGRLIIGSDTTSTHYPSTKPADAIAVPVALDKPEISQGEGPWVKVRPNLVSFAEDKATTGNTEVPVEDAADETPTGDPQPVSNTVATSGNTEVKSEPEKQLLVEVRVGATTDTDPSDAQYATTISDKVGEVNVPLCGTSTQRVWTKRFDPDGCRESEWVYEDMNVWEDETFSKVKDFDPASDGWGGGGAAGVIEALWGIDTLIDVVGNLEMNEVPSMFDDTANFTDSIFSMDEGPAMFSMDDVFPYGRIEGPLVTATAAHDFYPQSCPVKQSDNRLAERSIFSEDYHMFGEFHGPNGGVPPGHRKAVGAKSEINMFGTQSDGAPMRVLTEVDVDAAGYKIWKPGQRKFGTSIKSRYTIFSHRGLRAVSFSDWPFWRWIRNRKWEWDVPFDPDVPGGKIQTVVLDMAANSVVGLEVHAMVKSVSDAEAEYNVSVDLTTTPGSAIISVEQVTRQTETAAAGAWSATFPKAFGAAPTVVALGADSTNYSYVGYTTKSATVATGYMKYPPGTAGSEPVNGAGDVDIIARGNPLGDGAGGDLILTIQVMGA